MKGFIEAVLVCAILLTCAAGCASGDVMMPGEVREPMDCALFSVLNEDDRAFFEGYEDGAAEYMTVRLDQQYPDAIVDDMKVMREMVEALREIRVIAKTNISSTDGYHRIGFITAEGDSYSISFENSALCVGSSNYVLDNTKGFWSLCRDIAATGWERAQENAVKLQNQPIEYKLGLFPQTTTPTVVCQTVNFNAQVADDKRWQDCEATLSFTNCGGAPIKSVALEMQLLDFDGYIVDKASVTADFASAGIASGETAEYTVKRRVHNFIYSGASAGGVMGALVTLTGAARGEEASVQGGPSLFDFYNDPDVTAFAESFKDDPPASLTFVFNWFESSKHTVTDPETITAAFEALSRIVVGAQSDVMATDSDTYLVFNYDDGKEITFGFNLHNLSIRIDEHPYEEFYELWGDDELWGLIRDLYGM